MVRVCAATSHYKQIYITKYTHNNKKMAEKKYKRNAHNITSHNGLSAIYIYAQKCTSCIAYTPPIYVRYTAWTWKWDGSSGKSLEVQTDLSLGLRTVGICILHDSNLSWVCFEPRRRLDVRMGIGKCFYVFRVSHAVFSKCSGAHQAYWCMQPTTDVMSIACLFLCFFSV